jgi:hypothetical protein
MSIQRSIAVIAIPFLAAVTMPRVLQAADVDASRSARAKSNSGGCVLKDFTITSVRPYQVQQKAGGHVIMGPRLLGAEIYVQAQPGLTAEWLQLTLDRGIAGARRMAGSDCPLAVENVRAEVLSAGPGFTVRLIGRDSKAGQEILSRSRLLREQPESAPAPVS